MTEDKQSYLARSQCALANFGGVALSVMKLE